MPDYPPGYDPIQADYAGGSYISPGDQAIGGLVGLAAFGIIGVGAFFTYGAAATGQIATVTYVTGGQTLIFAGGTELTAGQAAIVAVVESGGLASEPAAVTAILSSWGLELQSLEGLAALAAYHVGPNTPFGGSNYGNWGQYLGNWVPGGGGFSGDPGFPGFPGGGFPRGGQSPGYWACVIVANGYEDCHWYF